MFARIGDDAYLRQTHRPLVCLVFLLPWVFAYELGTFLVGATSDATQPHVVAYLLLEHFFQLFGGTALYLPGFALVAILLVWHVAARDKWSLRWQTLAGMLAESSVLALPLLLFNQVLASHPASAPTAGWAQEFVLAIGAGNYEELLFRLICITLLSIVFVDLVKMNSSTAMVLMVLISSMLFAGHHYRPLGDLEFEVTGFLFRTAAGTYLATLFVVRGFGIAVGCHAIYDLIVVTWIAITT